MRRERFWPSYSFWGILLLALVSTVTAMASIQPASETSERLERWTSRWADDRIGWHEEGLHDALATQGDKIIPNFHGDVCANPVRVFFPLCGKTVDMAFLAARPSVAGVVGVDGVRKALEEFSTEHPDLEIKRVDAEEQQTAPNSQYERYEGKKIALLRGDFFELDETSTDGRFEAIFDRASLVAINPSLREDYVKVMGRLIQPGGKILLVVIERRSGTDEDLAGPPFSVPETEVRRLYEGQEWVKAVTLLDGEGEKARNEGTTNASLYYLIEAK